MKAISLTQPWATLVAIGAKRIETRSWATKYRGPIAIHAAKGFPAWCRDLCDTPPFRDVLRARYLGASDLPLGAVLAITNIMDCLPTPVVRGSISMFTDAPHELDFGDYCDGRYGFLFGPALSQVTPIPARGALGIWEWEASA